MDNEQIESKVEQEAALQEGEAQVSEATSDASAPKRRGRKKASEEKPVTIPKRGGRRKKAEVVEESPSPVEKKRRTPKAAAQEQTSSVFVQYQDIEADVSSLMDAARAQFKQMKPHTKVTDIKLYVKPEDRAAYYVINGQFDGKIEL